MTTLRDRIESNEQSGGSASLSKRTGKGRKHGRDSVSVLPPRDPIMWKHPDGKFGVHETWHPDFGGDQDAWDSALETLKVNEQTNDICQGNIGAGYFEQAKDEISVIWRLIGPYPKNWMDQGGSNPSSKGMIGDIDGSEERVWIIVLGKLHKAGEGHPCKPGKSYIEYINVDASAEQKRQPTLDLVLVCADGSNWGGVASHIGATAGSMKPGNWMFPRSFGYEPVDGRPGKFNVQKGGKSFIYPILKNYYEQANIVLHSAETDTVWGDPTKGVPNPTLRRFYSELGFVHTPYYVARHIAGQIPTKALGYAKHVVDTARKEKNKNKRLIHIPWDVRGGGRVSSGKNSGLPGTVQCGADRGEQKALMALKSAQQMIPRKYAAARLKKRAAKAAIGDSIGTPMVLDKSIFASLKTPVKTTPSPPENRSVTRRPPTGSQPSKQRQKKKGKKSGKSTRSTRSTRSSMSGRGGSRSGRQTRRIKRTKRRTKRRRNRRK